MAKGTIWPDERTTQTDPLTGVTLTKWTSHLSHHFHLYFTNSGWYDNGRKLLIGSERNNARNLYSLELETGAMMQLTDLDWAVEKDIQGTFINPVKEEAYFTVNGVITALDLNNLTERELFHAPAGYQLGNLSVTADGASLCFSVREDVRHRIDANLGQGYGGFEEIEQARPHCQIQVLDLHTGAAKVVHEESRWIGHVNASPTQKNIVTFCHEGPWMVVDHRIWVLNLATGAVWQIRAGQEGEYAGHEYWHADGLRIGYHGFTDTIEQKDGKFIGSIRFDNTEVEEFAFPYQNMHIHSNDAALIIGDGQQTSAYPGGTDQDYLFVWQKKGDRMDGPRILCRHRGSFQTQHVHVHPRFSPDGKTVLFTSDMTGYGHVYTVEMPSFYTLPAASVFT